MKKCILMLAILFAFLSICAQSIQETINQIQLTKNDLSAQEKLLDKKIAELRTTNPLFKSQDTFESDTEYLQRLDSISLIINSLKRDYLDETLNKLYRLRSATFKTSNFTISYGKYDPNTEVWDLVLKHNLYDAEEIQLKLPINRQDARSLNENRTRLIAEGILYIDFDTFVKLGRVSVKDPVSGATCTLVSNSSTPSFTIGLKSTTANAFSDDGKYFVAGNDQGRVVVYNLSNWSSYGEVNQPGVIESIAISPDSRFLAVGSNVTRVYDVTTMKAVWEACNGTTSYSVAFSPLGNLIAIGCGGVDRKSSVQVFDLESKNKIMEFEHWDAVFAVEFSMDGKYLLMGNRNHYTGGSLRVINVQTGKQLYEINPGSEVKDLKLSYDGKYLAVPMWIGVSVWDFRNAGKQINRIRSYDGRFDVAWSPVDYSLAVRDYDNKKIRLYDYEANQLQFTFDADGPVSFSSDGRHLAIGDTCYRIFTSIEVSEPEKTIAKPPQLSAEVFFSEPSGNKFLDAFEKGNIQVKITNTGQGSANNLAIVLSPVKISGIHFMSSFISEIPPNKTVSINIPIEAYSDVADGTHTLNVCFEEVNGFPPDPLQLTFSTRSYRKPQLAISDIGINDTNQNGKIETGEMIEVTLRIRNTGVGYANGAYAKFYPGENVFLTDKHLKTQSLGDLHPGQSKDLLLEFFINDRCTNEIPLYCDLTEATGLASVSKLRVPLMKSDQVRPIAKVIVTGIENTYSPSDSTSLQIDVEKDIPISKHDNKDDFAVIFGVENYAGGIPRVLYAMRDATWFREYALKTLGIPEQNIYFRVNEGVTKNEFDKVFGKGGWLDKRAQKISKVYFYFCGHGIPSLADKSAFLLPYDGDPNYAELTSYPLVSIYNALASLKSSHNSVILDACFTGISRENQALYVTSRPVFIIRDKNSIPQNVSVLSAADWNQMANAWPEKQHGLFTYFLLRGIQGSADKNQDRKISLAEIYDYLETEVPIQAGRLDKEQTPQLNSQYPDNILVEFE